MKHRKQLAKDHPAGYTLSVKGRAPQDLSRFQAPTRGTGKRWGNGVAPELYTPQLWGYRLPNGRIIYAASKGKGAWFKVEQK